MNRKTLTALLGAVVLALAATGTALAAGSGPPVSIKVKTLSKTLLHATGVHGEKHSITKGRTPRGKCPGSSAAGALDAATHGHWRGKYFASVHDIFITSILGVKPGKHEFWGVYVNGKLASTGACEIKLHRGEKLLFKITK
jgi:uncharacterized low-complexity protein